MALIWSDKLITGISVIDEQHQKLFEMINKLNRFVGNKNEFFEALIDLKTYTNEHFKTEEEYMKYTNYPDAETHKACHENFVADYMNILKKMNQVNDITDLGAELIAFIENWLEEHYTNEDVKLAEYLKRSSVE